MYVEVSQTILGGAIRIVISPDLYEALERLAQSAHGTTLDELATNDRDSATLLIKAFVEEAATRMPEPVQASLNEELGRLEQYTSLELEVGKQARVIDHLFGSMPSRTVALRINLPHKRTSRDFW